MNIKRIPAYLRACIRAVVSPGPRAYLKLLARSPYTVSDLPHYGVSMIVDVRDPAISKPILFLGEYERPVTDCIMSFVDENTRFVDVGANIGFFSLLVARRASRGKVWSVEPDPTNFRLLQANVALNGLERIVETHHVAASDTETAVFFSTLGHKNNIGARFTAKDKATLIARSLPGAPEPVQVRALTVDALLRGQKATLVKVDVEGFEPFVFAGMARVLEEDRPVVFCEFAPGTIQHISKRDPLEMLQGLRQRRYTISVIEADGRVSFMGDDAHGVLLRHSRGHQHHLDLLLIPEERANHEVPRVATRSGLPTR
jgi:FkbM family methyltransferase